MTSKNVTKVRHFQFSNNNRTAKFTVVSELEYRENEDTHTLHYTVAYCSPKDTFRKKDGVREALGSDKPTRILPIPKGLGFREINNLLIVDLINRRNESPKHHRKVLEGKAKELYS